MRLLAGPVFQRMTQAIDKLRNLAYSGTDDLAVFQLAELCGCTKETIRRHIKKGTLSSHRKSVWNGQHYLNVHRIPIDECFGFVYHYYRGDLPRNTRRKK